jgi:hypothetical protein
MRHGHQWRYPDALLGFDRPLPVGVPPLRLFDDDDLIGGIPPGVPLPPALAAAVAAAAAARANGGGGPGAIPAVAPAPVLPLIGGIGGGGAVGAAGVAAGAVGVAGVGAAGVVDPAAAVPVPMVVAPGGGIMPAAQGGAVAAAAAAAAAVRAVMIGPDGQLQDPMTMPADQAVALIEAIHAVANGVHPAPGNTAGGGGGGGGAAASGGSDTGDAKRTTNGETKEAKRAPKLFYPFGHHTAPTPTSSSAFFGDEKDATTLADEKKGTAPTPTNGGSDTNGIALLTLPSDSPLSSVATATIDTLPIALATSPIESIIMMESKLPLSTLPVPSPSLSSLSSSAALTPSSIVPSSAVVSSNSSSITGASSLTSSTLLTARRLNNGHDDLLVGDKIIATELTPLRLSSWTDTSSIPDPSTTSSNSIPTLMTMVTIKSHDSKVSDTKSPIVSARGDKSKNDPSSIITSPSDTTTLINKMETPEVFHHPFAIVDSSSAITTMSPRVVIDHMDKSSSISLVIPSLLSTSSLPTLPLYVPVEGDTVVEFKSSQPLPLMTLPIDHNNNNDTKRSVLPLTSDPSTPLDADSSENKGESKTPLQNSPVGIPTPIVDTWLTVPPTAPSSSSSSSPSSSSTGLVTPIAAIENGTVAISTTATTDGVTIPTTPATTTTTTDAAVAATPASVPAAVAPTTAGGAPAAATTAPVAAGTIPDDMFYPRRPCEHRRHRYIYVLKPTLHESKALYIGRHLLRTGVRFVTSHSIDRLTATWRIHLTYFIAYW